MGAGMAPEQLALLKQKCFRPGRYNGIRDSGEVSVRAICYYGLEHCVLRGYSPLFSSPRYHANVHPGA